MNETTHVVVIGGGFGGLSAARGLCRRGFRVTLIDRRSYHLFTPLLYQVATGSLAAGEVARPIRSLFRGTSQIECILGEVVDVRFEEKQVVLGEGQKIAYDFLIVAVGAQTHYFGNEDVWADKVQTLDDLSSAKQLRERLLLCCEKAEREPDPARRRELLTAAVLGGGPSGVELAGALADLADRTLAAEYRKIGPGDVRVVLFEAQSRVLSNFEPRLSESAKTQLEQLGVEVRLDEKVEHVTHDEVQTDRTRIKCGLICWGSGVRPADLVGFLDVPKKNGRVEVDDHCTLSEHPDVFAIGDIAYFEDQDGQSLPGLAPVAMQQGRYVAKAIVSKAEGKPSKPFRYRDKGQMATLGRSRAVVEAGPLRLTGWLAWLTWLVLHVAYLMSFRARLLVLFEWAWAYIGAKPGNRLIESEVRSTS